MKKILSLVLAMILTFAFSGTALAAKQFISVDQDPIFFGDIVPVVYGANFDNPWARADCYANETSIGTGLLFREFLYLGDSSTVWNDEFINLGVTPSWGGGGADCTLTLLKIRNGVFREVVSSEFEVLP